MTTISPTCKHCGSSELRSRDHMLCTNYPDSWSIQPDGSIVPEYGDRFENFQDTCEAVDSRTPYECAECNAALSDADLVATLPPEMQKLVRPGSSGSGARVISEPEWKAAVTHLAGADARALAARLGEKYPALCFDVSPAADVGVEPYSGSPAHLVTFGVDECVIDPFASGCGRFPSPPAEYGITFDDALAVRQHNRVFLAVAEGQERASIIEEAAHAAIDAACALIQRQLGVTAGDFAASYWSGRMDLFRDPLEGYFDAQREDALRNV